MDFRDFIPLAIVLLGAALIFTIIRIIYRRKINSDPTFKYYSQLFYNVFVVLVLIIGIAASPIKDSLKGQILSLIGIVVSGAFALSSTTLLGNALAGVMLKMTKNFRSGDFIQVNDYFGKVSARTLLNVEIQTIDRGLISLPNTYLVSNPVKVLPDSGIFLNVEVSLGYDISRSKIEQALLDAARSNDIENAYVEVKSLLDHCIVYSLHALVTDLERFFSTRSKLHASVVDQLHYQNIEIVSPKYMNSRSIDNTPVLSKHKPLETTTDENIDDLLFEKANLADKIELLKDKINSFDKLLERKNTSEELVVRIEAKKQKLIEQIAELEKNVASS